MKMLYFITVIGLFFSSCVKEKKVKPSTENNQNQKRIVERKSIGKKTKTDEKVVTISTGEFSPYTSQSLPGNGCILKMITDAYKAEGYTTNYLFSSWKNALKMTLTGRSDATAFWHDSLGRREKYLFSKNGFTLQKNFIYHLKDKNIEWNGFSDLKKYKIILNTAYTYNERFKKAEKEFKYNIIRVKDIKQNFKMLFKKRGDLTIMEEKVASKTLGSLGAKYQKVFVKHPKPIMEEKGYLLFNKGRPKALNVFNNGFKRIMSDNAYKKEYIRNCTQF